MDSDIKENKGLSLQIVNGLSLEIIDGETWTTTTTNNTREIQLKDLCPNIEGGAVAVKSEAQKIRQQHPQRILQSRLLHVAIPIDDMNQFDQSKVSSCSPEGEPCKAKSRWIAIGD